MGREVAARKVVGDASTNRLNRSLPRALLLLLLVVTLHPGLSTDLQEVHQPNMNVPIVARKGILPSGVDILGILAINHQSVLFDSLSSLRLAVDVAESDLEEDVALRR